jgi:hypothetical protein
MTLIPLELRRVTSDEPPLREFQRTNSIESQLLNKRRLLIANE